MQLSVPLPIADQRMVAMTGQQRRFRQQQADDLFDFFDILTAFFAFLKVTLELAGEKRRKQLYAQLPEEVCGVFSFMKVFTAIRFFKSFSGERVRNFKFKRQGFFFGHPGHHDAEGIGSGQAHFGKHRHRFIFYGLVDSGPDDGVIGHKAPPFSETIIAQLGHTGKIGYLAAAILILADGLL
jgi:hypothetical protein